MAVTYKDPMDNGEELLKTEFASNTPRPERGPFPSDPEPVPTQAVRKEGTHCQWAFSGNGKFSPVGSTMPVLSAGVYTPWADNNGYGLEQLSVTSDGIYQLPDMATEEVMREIHTFWNSEDRYREHRLLYKRGLLLWGPPGGGKSVTIKLLMQELIKRDGIVVIVNGVSLTIEVLKALRRIEPQRKLITVMEDIDEIIRHQGEAQVLSMLDGEHNIDNILQLASTNYPGLLGARIINRPSRFDRRVYVGMPGPQAREMYFRYATKDGIIVGGQLRRWVKDTEDMSIAHLRELVAAVYCLDQPYAEVIERLKSMSAPPVEETGFRDKTLGFRGKKLGVISSGMANAPQGDANERR